MTPLGPVLFSFFTDHLPVQKGLRPTSIRSYRDTVKLFLQFVAHALRRPVSRLSLEALEYDRVLARLSQPEG